MNDKITTSSQHLALTAIAMLLLASCSQEVMDVRGGTEDDDDIIFHVALPGVETETRSYDNIQAGDLQGGFSVAAIAPEIPSAGGKNYTIYFSPQLVTRTEGMGNAFRGDFCKWPNYTETNLGSGKLDFCAFYPSLETMREKSGVGNDPNYFLVHDVKNGTTYSYRMGNFKVNTDISTHMDFVAAFAQGSKAENLYSGVSLQFEHKLARVELKAWGANPGYDIEVAGVRIGGVIVKSTYNMNGNWIHNAIVWDCVDYIFNKGDAAVNRAADRILRIGAGNHDSEKNAASIMGNGGSALLIPHQLSNIASGCPFKWDIVNDATNIKGKNTNHTVTGNNAGMYFSVLMRVIDKTDDQGLVLYPYVDGATITGTTTASNRNSVYLVVEKATETVKGRVYKDKTTKQYFSDSTLKTPYNAPEDMEIREYGWAAIPYVATWWIGNSYTYVLDYSKGVGLHAPDDDAPGKTIITPYEVGITQEETVWKLIKDYEDEKIELDWNTDKIIQE